MMYDSLFERGYINGCELKNKIIMAPMDESLGDNSGNVSPRCAAYFLERAKGGTAALVTSYVAVCPPELGGIAMPGQIRLQNIGNQLSMANFVEQVHAYGAKLFVQLHHPGRKTTAEYNDFHEPVSCSAITPAFPPGTPEVHELTIDEIHEIERYFVRGAKFAMWAGADGVQLHCAHGYLLNQFINPAKNNRKDEYGGSRENRCRIVTEIVAGIREIVGPKYPITVRLNAFEGEGLPGEADADEMRQVGKLLAESGVNGIHLTMTSIDRVGTPDMKAGWRNDIYSYFREVVDMVPVYGPNEIKTPEEAEKVLASGCQDFIVLGRQHIADPDWVFKAKHGRADDIRPCISCNFCMQQITIEHQPLRCSVNPLAGRELDCSKLEPGTGNVAIIGAGVAGMQAALTAAKRGYDVTIYEKNDKVGGALQLANKAPEKFRIDNLIHYYENQIAKVDKIDLKLGVEITADNIQEIRKLNPEAVFVSSGGTQIVPNLPGVEKALLANDVLAKYGQVPGKNVIVVGGGLTGLETAQTIAANSSETSVKVIEMTDVIGKGVFNFNVTKTLWALKELGVEVMKKVRLEKINDGSISITRTDSGTEGEIPCDTVVLAMGLYPDHKLRDLMEKYFDNVIELGEARMAPGKIMLSVRDGYDRARTLR